MRVVIHRVYLFLSVSQSVSLFVCLSAPVVREHVNVCVPSCVRSPHRNCVCMQCVHACVFVALYCVYAELLFFLYLKSEGTSFEIRVMCCASQRVEERVEDRAEEIGKGLAAKRERQLDAKERHFT